MQDVPIDRLGPYPILQFAAAIVVLGGLALAIWRGTRDRRSASSQLPEGTRWFFDGPLAMSINLMRDQKNHLDRIVEQNEHILSELRGIRSDVQNLPSHRRGR